MSRTTRPERSALPNSEPRRLNDQARAQRAGPVEPLVEADLVAVAGEQKRRRKAGDAASRDALVETPQGVGFSLGIRLVIPVEAGG
jgi:hypothetical protein